VEANSFASEISSEPINLPRATLCFAREIAYPELDINAYLQQLDDLAESAQRSIARGLSASEKAEALADFLFVEERFQGNASAYSDPRNSFLNDVLERRLGIPVSLSVIYISAARQLDLPVQGIGLPGHFIVSVPAGDGDIYIDPFHGGARLTAADCAQLVRQVTGYSGDFRPEWLQPMTVPAILTRMLNNLRNIYYQQEDWGASLKVLEHLRLLQPEMHELLRDLGLVHHRRGALHQAVQYYELYLARAENAPDSGTVRYHMESAVKSLAQLN
jgi:regulator of sirC expression with transglutaminase-like and TPR domain